MSYNIKGFQKFSMVDYPGKIAAVLFTGGCNFACPYCHNESLVKGTQPTISWEKIIKPFLEKRKNLLDGVVISGGEPSMHPWVVNLMAEIKKIGFDIKLDTNGTSPEFIKQCLDEGLVDYIAMDIKAPFNKYVKVCRCHLEDGIIRESVEVIMDSKVDYQFRTTMVPTLVDLNDVQKIALQIKGAKRYVLQQFKPVESMLDKSLMKIKPYSIEKIQLSMQQVKEYVQKVELANF